MLSSTVTPILISLTSLLLPFLLTIASPTTTSRPYASFRIIASGPPHDPCTGHELHLLNIDLPLDPTACYGTPGDNNITCVQRRTMPVSQEARQLGGAGSGSGNNDGLLDTSLINCDVTGFYGGDQCGGTPLPANNATDNLSWSWTGLEDDITGVRIQCGGS